VNRILDDLVAALAPRRIEVRGAFRGRGGITSTVTARRPEAPWPGEGA
jgi:7-cyano-7-deazaguanine reductase